MTSNSLTQNEEYDIPSQILKSILDCTAHLFFRPQYVCFLVDFYVALIPNSSSQLAELIAYIILLE